MQAERRWFYNSCLTLDNYFRDVHFLFYKWQGKSCLKSPWKIQVKSTWAWACISSRHGVVLRGSHSRTLFTEFPAEHPAVSHVGPWVKRACRRCDAFWWSRCLSEDPSVILAWVLGLKHRAYVGVNSCWMCWGKGGVLFLLSSPSSSGSASLLSITILQSCTSHLI